MYFAHSTATTTTRRPAILESRYPIGRDAGKVMGGRHGAKGCRRSQRWPAPTHLEEHLMTITFDSALVAALARQISGTILVPEDEGYDAARAVHNGLIDRRPALIVRS